MKEEIKIPTVGESVTEVTIGTFLKQSGEFVEEGAELVEIETEKVNQILYATAKGVVNWTVSQGDTASIGQIIGTIDTEGKGEAKKAVKEAPQPKKEEKKAPPTGGGRVFQEEFLKEKPAPTKKKEVAPEPKKSGNRKKMSKIRQVIAKRLTDVLQETAMLTTFNEVDMSTIMQLRSEHQEAFQKLYGVKLGFMSFFVKAVVSALKEFPDVHSFIEGEEIVTPETIDIGIAVGSDRGLVVPIVRNTEKKSFGEIEQEIAQLAVKVREGKIAIDDLTGGSFTITNGGVYGSLLSTPILNPPQSAILGMHKIEKRAVVVDDQIVIRPMMYLALSYDHRLIDGKEAVSFLVKVKEVLEDPTRLLFLNGEETSGSL